MPRVPVPKPFLDLLAVMENELPAMYQSPAEQRKALARVLIAFGDVLETFGAIDLSPIPSALLDALMDVEIGGIPELFTPDDPKQARPAWEINLSISIVRLVDVMMRPNHRPQMTERQAIKQVLPIMQRRFPQATANTIENLRRELQRQSSGKQSATQAARQRRYQQPLPPMAGESPESQAAWLLVVIEKRWAPQPPSQKS